MALAEAYFLTPLTVLGSWYSVALPILLLSEAWHHGLGGVLAVGSAGAGLAALRLFGRVLPALAGFGRIKVNS